MVWRETALTECEESIRYVLLLLSRRASLVLEYNDVGDGGHRLDDSILLVAEELYRTDVSSFQAGA